MSAWFEQRLETAAAPPPLAERIAQVAGAELLPLVKRIDEGHYPERVLRRLGEVGAFSPHLLRPEGVFDAISAMAAVGRHCLATAFCVWCQDTFAWYLANTGNLELRQRLLEGAGSGSVLGGTGLSNPMKAGCGIEPMRL
ncbi:MAG TPA: acyl-CoA dehydrogenase family protein, partial [Myxococcales bacterium]